MVDKSFLNWPFFEARHRTLAGQLEAWAAENLGTVDHHDTDAACRMLVTRLGEAGWLQLTAPDEDGGRLDVRSLALTRETLARHDGLADFSFAMQGLGAGPISLFGNAAQRAAWLPRTRAGTAIAAFALTEPASGSDVANIATAARRDGDSSCLTVRRPGSPTAASPISMWCSRARARLRARVGCRLSSSKATIPALPLPSAFR